MKSCTIRIFLVYIMYHCVMAKPKPNAVQSSVHGSGAGCDCQRGGGGSVGSGRPPTPTDDNDIKCGTKAMIGRVVGGKNAPAKSWPWQIGIKSCSSCKFFCGGTIVAKKWVITAAHCLHNYGASDIFIDAGVINQKKKSKYKQSFNCTAIHRHQLYGINAPYDEDIAILELDKEVKYNDHVRPLCLNEKRLNETRRCSVTGFGRKNETGPKSFRLKQLEVPIVAHDICVKSYKNAKPSRPVTKNMICAGYKQGGKDACSGDSGGPMSCFDVGQQRYVLGGIVSWGVGCARADSYGVYTDIEHLVTWITSITGDIQ